MRFRARRFHDQPIIHPGLSSALGHNINGPCLIRVPPWVEAPLGRYYLYFAHHEGRSIRLAYADALTGPWHLHPPGALRIEDSLFPSDPAQITPRVGRMDPHAQLGISEFIPHIASPDVLMDRAGQRLLLFFHGMLEDGAQKTRLALSRDGVSFEAQPAFFDHYYLRVFAYRGWYWAISWGGYLYRAARPEGPFERGPPILEGAPLAAPGTILRHLALWRRGDQLQLFYSRIGDTPEVILHAEIGLDVDWHHWTVGAPQEILRPSLDWEGASLPVVTSRAGVAHKPEHALRDPYLFEDADGALYLLYSAAAEQAIGIVALEARP